jgi:hypothetical protein
MTIVAYGCLGLLQDDKVFALVVRHALVASNPSLREQKGVGFREAAQTNASLSSTPVQMSCRESLRVVILDKVKPRGKGRGATVRENIGLPPSLLCQGPVLVENSTCRCVLANEGQTSTDVNTGDISIVDGRLEVLGKVGDIDHQAEAL